MYYIKRKIVPIFLFILVFDILKSVNSCVLLLNGWTFMEVDERAKKADIVVAGYAKRTFKEERNALDETYWAEFSILSVYKGLEHLERLNSVKLHVGSLYDGSNLKVIKVSSEKVIGYFTNKTQRITAATTTTTTPKPATTTKVTGRKYDFVIVNESRTITYYHSMSQVPLSALANLPDHSEKKKKTKKPRQKSRKKEPQIDQIAEFHSSFPWMMDYLKRPTGQNTPVLEKLLKQPDEFPMVNVSHFGDQTNCYADVEDRRTYILFLTVLGDHLAAKYDDIFGAAAPFTPANERKVLSALGYSVWSDWSPCSATCGGGIQTRRRVCHLPKLPGVPPHKSDCVGAEDKQRRSCNSFPCSGIRDLVKIFNFAKKKQHKVKQSSDRKGAFSLDKNSHVRLPLYVLFPLLKSFPKEFSIMITARSKGLGIEGYFLGISDASGRKRMTLKWGNRLQFQLVHPKKYRPHGQNSEKNHHLRIWTAPSKSLIEMIIANTTIADGGWHHVAVSVRRSSMQLFVDGVKLSTVHRLAESDYNSVQPDVTADDIPMNSVLSIGYVLGDQRMHKFEGDIDQLIISTDSGAASQHSGYTFQWTVSLSASTVQTAKKPKFPQALTNSEALSQDAPAPAEDYRELPKDRKKPRRTSPYLEDSGDSEGSGDLSISEDGSGNYEIEWSAWSPCSATCGKGIRRRTSFCVDNGRTLEECIEAQMEKTETQSCRADDCANQSTRNATKLSSGQRHQNCHINCLNGGTCIPGKHKCACLPGFYGSACDKVACSSCLNGGTCVRANVCSCAEGYTGMHCQMPQCPPRCFNGGTCISPGRCLCQNGYTGRNCDTAVCNPPCQNQGRCVSANRCACSSGYTDADCSRAICVPACQNGGICVRPNVCSCRPEASGAYCEKVTCTPECLNSGTCTGINNCTCTPDFNGPRCERPICKPPCSNSGICISPGQCSCTKGHSGKRCEKKNCAKYYATYEPYQKKERRKRISKSLNVSCATAAVGVRACISSSTEYETVYKTFFRTAYKCADSSD